MWKHTQKPGQPSNLVMILVDLTPLVDGRGPAQLLDIRPGRSADVLCTWLQERVPGFRSQVQVVSMDGFTGYATAVDQVLPQARKVMEQIINTLRKGVPKGLEERAQLGRTLWRRCGDVLAYFDIGASNGPVEAINGRLENLRGTALGFRNLDYYILRCLIHSGLLHTRINAL